MNNNRPAREADEFSLAELWNRQRDRTLTHSAYEQVDQLSGAIAQRTERVFRSLNAVQQEAGRHLLTRLVHLADVGCEHTRRQIPLAALYSDELLNKDSGRKVLSLLIEARLVTIALASDCRQQMVEIAHEALVRRWPRFKLWLQEDREILLWRQRLGFLNSGMASDGNGRGVSSARVIAG